MGERDVQSSSTSSHTGLSACCALQPSNIMLRTLGAPRILTKPLQRQLSKKLVRQPRCARCKTSARPGLARLMPPDLPHSMWLLPGNKHLHLLHVSCKSHLECLAAEYGLNILNTTTPIAPKP